MTGSAEKVEELVKKFRKPAVVFKRKITRLWLKCIKRKIEDPT